MSSSQVAIPDNLTIPQFIFDYSHPLRPNRPEGLPCLVVDKTSRTLGLPEVGFLSTLPDVSSILQVQARTNAFALVLRERYHFGKYPPVQKKPRL